MSIQLLKIVALILTSAIFFGCTTTTFKSYESTSYVSLVAPRSLNVEPGMTLEELLTVMGPPKTRQSKQDKEAFQWCDISGSSSGSRHFLLVWVTDGKVNSSVRWTDSLFHQNCIYDLKVINWSDAPDEIIETRER